MGGQDNSLAWRSTNRARRSTSNAMDLPPFHLAFPVDDLAAARRFYGGQLGCSEGRSSETWVDFNLHGHQIVAHLANFRATTGAK